MSDLTWGDGRTDRGCALLGATVLAEINESENLEQLDTLLWRSSRSLYAGKSSKMSHLTGSQHHWTAVDPKAHLALEEMAKKEGLSLTYIFITPVSQRLSRKEQKMGVEVPLPSEGHVWTVPGTVVGGMFAKRYMNESGYQHFWILEWDGWKLSPVATPSLAQIVRLQPDWHRLVRITEKARTPAAIKDVGTTIRGNRLNVDLMVGDIHVVGTLEFSVSAR